MNRPFTRILCAALVSCAAADARQILREHGNTVVRVPDTAPAGGVPRVEIQRPGGAPVTVELDNRTALVEDVRFAGPDSIIVHGKTYAQSPRTDTISVIDARSDTIVDTIWALDASFSPDGKTVAYFYRTPGTGSQGDAWGSLVAYDLTAPAWNARWRASEEPDSPSFRGRGIVLYPEKHRLARRYWFFLPPEQGRMSNGHERYGYVSDIAWSPDSTHLAIVEYEADVTRLVAIDVSRGLVQPRVATSPIPWEQFGNPDYGRMPPNTYSDYRLFIKNVAFSADGRGVVVTSSPTNRFLGLTVTLPIPEPAERR